MRPFNLKEEKTTAIDIPHKVYQYLAHGLHDEVNESSYFTGDIIVESEKYTFILQATIINRFIPAWWEFKVIDSSGSEVENNFNWNTFKGYMY